jgi:hypothetical protein
MNELLRQWIVAVTGYDDQHVIRANQNGPRPVGDYATYQIISIVPDDHAWWSDVEIDPDEITQTFRVRATMIVDVNVYSLDGWTKLSELGLSNNVDVYRGIFAPDGTVLKSKGTTRDLALLGDTSWRDRYQSDFTFAIYNTLDYVNKRRVRFNRNN